MTGYEAESWLREHYRIEVELSDLYNILCIITPGDSRDSINYLISALAEMAASFGSDEGAGHKQIPVHVAEMPRLALSPRDAFYAETESVPFRESIGRIIAEFVMVYPPGIPIFTPGEIITAENLDFIEENIEAGLPVQGPEDPTLRMLKVVKENVPIR
jgi:lysine decarboxylase